MNRLFVSVIITTFLFSLTACAGSPAESGGDNNSQSKGSSSWNATTGKYEPNITLTVGTAEADPSSEKIAGQTQEDNVWIDAYRDELGIKFEDMFVVSSAQLEEKLNLQIASGQVPDLMAVNRKQFEMLVKSGLATDLTEVYEKYASEKTKKFLVADSGICLDMSKINGTLYALPATQGYLESAGVVTWLRKDWLDKLKLEAPKNFDDLYKVMKAFTNDDPDGNGLKDTYAFTTSNTLDELIGLFDSFGSHPKSWVKNTNGEIVYGGTQPETKAALAFLNKAFKEGLINREFGANDWNQFTKAIDSSKVGVAWLPWYSVDWPLGASHREMGAEWIPLKIYGADGGDAKVMGVAGPDTYYVIRKGYEHPEAIVNMFNLWFEKAYGSKENILKYHKNEKGEMPAKFSQVKPWLAHEDIGYYLNIQDKLAGKDVGEMSPSNEMYYEGVMRYMTNPTEDDYITYKMYGPDSASGILNYYMKNDLVLQEEYFSTGTETMKKKWGVLETKKLEVYVKIIMGAAPIDAFDDFVKDWDASGGQQIVKEVRESVQQNK